jgi:hypothetical protein
MSFSFVYRNYLKLLRTAKSVTIRRDKPPVTIVDAVNIFLAALIQKLATDPQPDMGHFVYGVPGVGKSIVSDILAACLCRKKRVYHITCDMNNQQTYKENSQDLIDLWDVLQCEEKPMFIIFDQMNYASLRPTAGLSLVMANMAKNGLVWISSGHHAPEEFQNAEEVMLLSTTLTEDDVLSLMKDRMVDRVVPEGLAKLISDTFGYFEAVDEAIVQIRLGNFQKERYLVPEEAFFFTLMGRLQNNEASVINPEHWMNEMRPLAKLLSYYWGVPDMDSIANVTAIELKSYTLSWQQVEQCLKHKCLKDKADKFPISIFFSYLEVVKGGKKLTFKFRKLFVLKHVLNILAANDSTSLKNLWEFAVKEFNGSMETTSSEAGFAFQRLCSYACRGVWGKAFGGGQYHSFHYNNADRRCKMVAVDKCLRSTETRHTKEIQALKDKVYIGQVVFL